MNKLIFIVVFLFSQSVFAHKTSDSYLNVSLSEKQSSIIWSIAIKDLEYAVGIDMNEDSNVTWNEVLQRQPAIEAYVLSRLSLSTVSQQVTQNCIINNKSLLVDDKEDGAYLVFDIVSPCLDDMEENGAARKNLIIDYQLMFDIDKNHRGLILVNSDDGSTSFVANPDNHTFSLQNKSVGVIYVLIEYVVEGIWHILIGFDHILFLLALLLPSVLIHKNGRWLQRDNITSSFMSILKIVTAFTLAHSITLTLSVLKLVSLPSQWVEVTIAVTVLLTCLHTLKPIFQHSLWKLAFFFGLIHGFGFANVLLDLGLNDSALAVSLLGFNIGVELGQLFIVLLFVMFSAVANRYWWYKDIVFKGGITITALLSCVWIVERLFNYEIIGI